MSDASKYAVSIVAVKHSKMILLSSFKALPHLGQRLCLIFSLLSSAAFAQSPFFEITQKPAQVAVTTAHPMATEAALKILQQGGSAIDAAIAAQLMLAEALQAKGQRAKSGSRAHEQPHGIFKARWQWLDRIC